MMRPHRSHALWYAFMVHRVSGIVLALFLPVHFYTLAMALTAPAQLDGFLQWTDMAAVKFAEFGLVLLLALHMFGGLRLMAMEWLPWSDRQKTLAAGAAAISLLISGVFLLRAI